MAKKTRTFMFEGAERSTAEIREAYFPGVPHGTLYTRLISSGATSRAEYMAYMCGGAKKSSKAESDGNRFGRRIRARTENLVSERGCNYCQQMKPMHRLKRAGPYRWICDACAAQRQERLTNKTP